MGICSTNVRGPYITRGGIHRREGGRPGWGQRTQCRVLHNAHKRKPNGAVDRDLPTATPTQDDCLTLRYQHSHRHRYVTVLHEIIVIYYRWHFLNRVLIFFSRRRSHGCILYPWGELPCFNHFPGMLKRSLYSPFILSWWMANWISKVATGKRLSLHCRSCRYWQPVPFRVNMYLDLIEKSTVATRRWTSRLMPTLWFLNIVCTDDIFRKVYEMYYLNNAILVWICEVFFFGSAVTV